MTDDNQPAPWQPANATELAMAGALAAGDTARYFRIVESAELYLPAFTSDGTEAGRRFVTRELLGITYLLVYTSLEALAVHVRGVADGFTRVSYGELLREWPRPQWRLAINQGTPIEACMRVEAVADAARGDLLIPTFGDALAANAVDAGLASLDPDDIDSAVLAALGAGDADGYVAVLLNAPVRIPTTVEVGSPPDLMAPDFPWLITGDAQAPVIQVFTSDAAMAWTHPRPVPHAVAPLPAALAVWPEGVGLAVNPDTPYRFALPSHQVQLLLFWPTPPATASPNGRADLAQRPY
jgi:hypothetical protein